ncbi:MAG: c-type cytochrome [Candidatus Promineifilaceae bacterium]|nr:c-type cytochrome [Candidatus Promineifilaceae bacterium]
MNNRFFGLLPHAAMNYFARRAALLLSLILLFVVFVGSAPARAQEPLEPPERPNAESVAPVFNERCANCHGPQGRGDGELAANLPQPPRDYTEPEFLRGAIPATLFQTITEGRLDAGMPPFGPSSSDPIPTGERWDLVAMVYSLGTAPESIEDGWLVYDENCSACHGESGLGDGPEAGDQETSPSDLTDLRYWSNRSNEMVAAVLADNDIAAHAYELQEEEIWSVVDYSRTFSYDYFDPLAALEPIEAATISGLVINGTRNELLAEGTATLRAFTMDLEEAFSMTAEVDAEGRFTFDLEQTEPDLVYLASVEHEGLTFNSSPDRLLRSNPVLDMPITVFDQTRDPQAISIEQVHLVLEFVEDRVAVSEIYVLNNQAPAVFVGASGNAADGTLEIGVPEGAGNVNFQRSFDSFGNFLPASEVIQTDRGWADTMPIRPGESVMNFLVTYDLPYRDGLDFSHPVFYDASSATVVMPDVGVDLEGAGWQDQGVQQMGSAGAFTSFGRSAVQAGESLGFELQGRATEAAVSRVNTAITGDSATGLLLGAGVLLLVIAGGVLTVRSWQNPEADQDVDNNKEALLQELADLEDAYEAGQLDEKEYGRRHESLMSELLGIWQSQPD